MLSVDRRYRRSIFFTRAASPPISSNGSSGPSWAAFSSNGSCAPPAVCSVSSSGCSHAEIPQIPSLGMQQIPLQLASHIPSANLRTRTKVASIGDNRVALAGGGEITARSIVVATEGPEAGRLLGENGPGSRNVTCLYFAAEKAPVTEPVLVLDGQGAGPVNNLCVPSILSPELAPPGAALISATVLDQDRLTVDQLEAESRNQLTRWFGDQVRKWRLLRTYRIPHAQPDPSVARPRRAPRVAPNLYVCGDHCLHASIEPKNGS